MSPARGSIACVVSRYPAVSHAFIVREVQALRRHGLDVHTFTIRRPRPDELLSAADREEHGRTFAVLPPRPLRLLGSHLRGLMSHPLRYVGTLVAAQRLSPPGVRDRLWRLFYFGEAIVVWDECRRRGVRHLHAHFANVGSDVAMLASRFGGSGWSWSFMMHGCVELFDEAPHRLPHKVRDARLVVCTSDFVRAQLMGLVEREHWRKLQVSRCALDARAFAAPPRARGKGRLHILTVARLVASKGQAVLLEALAELRARGVDADVTFVGDGPDRAALDALAGELGVGDRVRFTGAVGQDELPGWYRRADLFCLPTFSEGLGVVLIEAMAAGLPVVSTRVMGVPEVIEDGDCGLLVSPGRADELAAAIERMATSPDLRARMGRRGRVRVEREFDLDSAGRRLAELFEQTLRGTGNGTPAALVDRREPAAA
jgi:colanic acid/amylovoran biosynthesis glycosyltransferase